jgi:hypothetical protein
MKAARSIDVTAKNSAELFEQFNIKVTEANILFWEKSIAAGTRDADITLPKFLFRPEVLKELERNFS